MSRNVLAMYTCVCLLAAAMGAEQAQAAEIDKGYVVFEHNTLASMPSDYVPDREKIAEEHGLEVAHA